jgi:hypothetical protein
MAITGASDVASTIQKVVSALTTRTLIQESVALNIPGVWDRSGEVMEGMDRLDMIQLAELAVQDVNEAGGEMTPQTINPSSAMLLLDQHKSIPFALTSKGDIQSKIALVQRTVENGIRSLAAQVDDAIFAEAVANAGTTEIVAASDALAALLGAKQQFDEDNVPRMDRAVVLSPAFCALLLGTNNVIRANEFGSANPIQAARVANIYGMEVYESSSSSIPNDGFVAFGMEALAFARQRQVQFEQQRQVLAQKTDYTITHLYGVESTAASNPRIYVYDPA